MQTVKGTVSKIKVLKLSSPPLIRFTVNNLNCLIAQHSLNFIYEVQDNSDIVVGGKFNKLGQFVVKRYCVLNNILN